MHYKHACSCSKEQSGTNTLIVKLKKRKGTCTCTVHAQQYMHCNTRRSDMRAQITTQASVMA